MHISAHGVETQYQVMGKGTPLVLLHGWGCDWQIWYPVIGPLSEKYQLIIPDLPAFGHSHNPSFVWSSQDYVQWLHEFLQQVVKGKKFFLVGHSFGGKVASLYTASHSEKAPQKLVLVDSSGMPDALSTKQKTQQRLLQLIPQALKQKFPLSFKRKVLKMAGSATDHLDSTEMQRQILRKGIRERIGNDLVRIPVPTLLIWGKNDPETPLHHAEQFQQYLKNAHLTVFEKSGHFPFLDETEHFLKTLTKFLAE